MTESGQEMCPNTFDEVFLTGICEKIFNCVSFRVSTVVTVIVIQIFIKIK